MKKVTLESLAQMVAKGFLSVEERLDTLEAKIDLTNTRIDKVVIPPLEEHSQRIKKLELKTS